MLAAILFVWLHPMTPERVIDGDTFVAWVETRPEMRERVRVRLDCYSAPELRHDGGVEAAAKLAAYLDGGTVLRTSWKREKYGRLLGEPCHADAGCFCGGAP